MTANIDLPSIRSFKPKPNIVPLDGKRPTIKWKKWQHELQTSSEVDNFNTESGWAILNGVNGWRSIDIDRCNDIGFIENILDKLGLLHNYAWTIKSAHGFHIWYISYENTCRTVEKYDPPNGRFKQIEHRMSGCYTAVPPSLHPDGVEYRWFYREPQKAPAELCIDGVDEVLKSVSTPKAPIPTPNDNTHDPAELERIKSALSFLSEHEPRLKYQLWLRLSSAVVDELGEKKGVVLMKEYFPPIDEDGRDYEKKKGQWLNDYSIATLFYEAEERGWSYQNPERSTNADNDGAPLPTCAADVEPEEIRWLWDGYFAEGKMHLVTGQQGTGKTVMLLNVASDFSKGRTPTGEQVQPINTLYLSGEDEASDTLTPRVQAANGDTNRIHFYDARHVGEISFPDFTEDLKGVIEELSIRFCVIDPLFSFLSRKYSKNSEQDVREVLSGLSDVAADTGCALVLVRHPNKKEGLEAINRGGGSVAISAHARFEFTLGWHPNHENKRAFAWTKNNLSPKSRYESLTFDLVQSEQYNHPVVQWTGTENITADDLYRKKSKVPKKKNKACEWLRETLENGPVPSSKLKEMVDHQPFSWKTVERAKKEIGATSQRDNDHWVVILETN